MLNLNKQTNKIILTVFLGLSGDNKQNLFMVGPVESTFNQAILLLQSHNVILIDCLEVEAGELPCETTGDSQTTHTLGFISIDIFFTSRYFFASLAQATRTCAAEVCR